MHQPRPADVVSRKSPRMARAWRAGRVVLVAGGLMAAAGLGGCMETVESLNPGRLFGTDQAEEPPPPGADQEFPNLASVPETPRKSSSPAEIAEIREGLVADRERARYTDEALRNSATDEVNFAESTGAGTGARRPLSAQGDAAAEAEDVAAARAAQAKLDALAASKTEAPPDDARVAAPAQQSQAALDTPSNALLRFEPGSTDLSNEAIERLVQLVGRYGEVGGTLRVIGHAAGSEGGGAEPRTLAYDRALVVAAELKRLGVAAERMRVIADDAGEGISDDRVDVVIEP